jgi:hypothetical protein
MDASAEGGRRERTCLPEGEGEYHEWPEQPENAHVEPGTRRSGKACGGRGGEASEG